jgi:hypothetical protein
MNMSDWKKLYSTLRIKKPGEGGMRPIPRRRFLNKPTVDDLETFETKYGLKLPTSYRHYALVFGAGVISGRFEIAVPGYGPRRTQQDLMAMNTHGYFAKLQKWDGLDNPKQINRMLVFCETLGQDYIGWDPTDVTETRNHEYGIYVLLRLSVSAKKIAATFDEFINKIVLGSGTRKVNYHPLPKYERLVFAPAHG